MWLVGISWDSLEDSVIPGVSEHEQQSGFVISRGGLEWIMVGFGAIFASLWLPPMGICFG